MILLLDRHVRRSAKTLAFVGVAGFLGLAGFLVIGSFSAFASNAPEIMTSGTWSYAHESYGALSMIYGTLVVSSVALLLAGPLGILAAVAISEILSPRVGVPVRAGIELLAGIPSVVYGLLGVLYLVPFVHGSFDSPSGDTLLTGGLLLAIMILPTVVMLSESALRSVPADLRYAARALGLTRAETTLAVVLPAARSGVFSSLLFAFGRASGETIAVFLVIGRADSRLPQSLSQVPASLLHAGQTLTSKLGGSEVPIAYGADGVHGSHLAALAALLFGGVILFSVSAEILARRSL